MDPRWVKMAQDTPRLHFLPITVAQGLAKMDPRRLKIGQGYTFYPLQYIRFFWDSTVIMWKGSDAV
jgi:hypothetical protein